jgi:diacylglycerol kinase (ATP)
MEKTPRDILFIVNPKAGITIKSKFLIRLLAGQYLDQDRFNAEIQFTKYATHATELAAEAVKNGTPIVVAVGGDGTVNEVARALVHTETILGILPTGSGNGLAHHLKIPMSLIKALQVINTCNTRWIDTVDLNGKIFTSIAGIGFDAAVAEKFASSGVRGLLSYMRIIIQEYRQYPPGDYELHIDGVRYHRNALMISFANSDQFGFHSRIAPQAMIDDGWLDVCVVMKPAFHKILFAAPRVFFGTFGKTGYAEYFRGKHIRIPGTSGQKVNLDGEAVRLEEDLNITVKPKSLRVIVR